MTNRRVAIIAGGAQSIAAAVTKVMEEQGQAVLSVVKIERPEPEPFCDVRLDRGPRRKDWQQRERRRSRR